MRIYFDMCCLQRPLDDRTQLRVDVEAQAVLGLLAYCKSGAATVVSSDTLRFEAEGNPDPVRRGFAIETIANAGEFIQTNDGIRDRAGTFVEAGIAPLDALHLASAVESGVDYFCTCDDRLLKKAQTVATARTNAVSPLELLTEIQP